VPVDPSAHAAQVVRGGGIIAYPTEAVWGLGCDPFNQDAVNRLCALKQRSLESGLILLAARIEQFAQLLTQVTASEYQRLNESWPGAVTWLVKHNGVVPTWIVGKHPNVALRVTAHLVAAQLCARTGILVSTSANVHGSNPATSMQEIEQDFADKVDYIYPGELGGRAQVSQIIELSSNKQYR
jgi:L-threonylcarbamoyladenylate synthase